MDGIALDGLTREQLQELAVNAESRAVRRRAVTRLASPEQGKGKR